MGAPGPELFRRRLVGLYALTLMEREGPLHGYALSERIAQATEGAWRPGPGSVYPSLRKLLEMRLARVQRDARRHTYRITPTGRDLMKRIRSARGWKDNPRADLSPLWAEVTGSDDVAGFLVHRLHRTLDALENQMRRAAGDLERQRRLHGEVLLELRRATERFGQLGPHDRPAPPMAGGRHGK